MERDEGSKSSKGQVTIFSMIRCHGITLHYTVIPSCYDFELWFLLSTSAFSTRALGQCFGEDCCNVASPEATNAFGTPLSGLPSVMWT